MDKSARRRVLDDFARLVQGREKCLSGHNCPEVETGGITTHDELGGVAFGQHHGHYARMIVDVFGPDISFTFTAVAGRAYLAPIQIPFTVTVDRIGYFLGGVSAGNLRAGIYADNGDTPAGGALLVQSAAVPCGTADRKNEIAVAETQLTRGLYWLGIQGDDATVTYYYIGYFQRGGTLTGKYYDHAYGPFEEPCPAVAEAFVPCLYGRVASIP